MSYTFNQKPARRRPGQSIRTIRGAFAALTAGLPAGVYAAVAKQSGVHSPLFEGEPTGTRPVRAVAWRALIKHDAIGYEGQQVYCPTAEEAVERVREAYFRHAKRRERRRTNRPVATLRLAV